MRLIDADAYKQAIIKMMSSYGSGNYSNDYEKMIADEMIADCISALHEMPTISPESILPQGLWIENNDEYDNYHYCSNCEKRAPNYIEELKRTLKKVTEQRDMAINDLYELAQKSSKRCEYCKFNKSGCDWCIYDPDEELNFVWRGMIEEKTK